MTEASPIMVFQKNGNKMVKKNIMTRKYKFLS